MSSPGGNKPAPRAVSVSERQIGVLLGVRDGRSNAEIAQHLGISKDTVKTYLRNLFRKLDCRDRTLLVIRAIQIGAIPLGEGDGSIVLGVYAGMPRIRQMKVLTIMCGNDRHRWGVTELSTRLDIKKSHVRIVLEALVAKGWVTRNRSDTFYQITNQGRKVYLRNHDDFS